MMRLPHLCSAVILALLTTPVVLADTTLQYNYTTTKKDVPGVDNTLTSLESLLQDVYALSDNDRINIAGRKYHYYSSKENILYEVHFWDDSVMSIEPLSGDELKQHIIGILEDNRDDTIE